MGGSDLYAAQYFWRNRLQIWKDRFGGNNDLCLFLVADRIGYLYEPILGGGFPETGGLILTAAFGCVLWRDLSEAYKIRLTYEVYSHQTELRLLAQKNHYDRLKEQMEETSRVRHDMRQHLRVLSALLEREQYGEMQKYLCRYTREFQERLTYHSYCKNQVADAILHYYEELCRKNGIVFQCQVEAPEKQGSRIQIFVVSLEIFWKMP